MIKRRRIAVVIGSRANYASIKSVMHSLKSHDNVELLIFAGASAILGKFGNVDKLVEQDGFSINERYYMLVEGETPETMATSTGLGIIRLTNILMNHKPDIVITVGDRFETMATTIATAYLNIHLAHTMGGEVTGTIDESIRHAVTKFAHLHFPANQDSADRIVTMGENLDHVFVTGCPRIDEVNRIVNENRNGIPLNNNDFWYKYKGVGANFSIEKDKFLLVMQHPVTTEFDKNRLQMRETLAALEELKMPSILLWPNADAGSDEISKEIRTFRENNKPDEWLHIFKNLPMDVFVKLMDNCSCMVGNSSSQIREGAIIGVPAVNIGSRQNARLRGENVLDVPNIKDDILSAVQQQLSHGKYDADTLYGDGRAGERIAEVLSKIKLSDVPIQKQITI